MKYLIKHNDLSSMTDAPKSLEDKQLYPIVRVFQDVVLPAYLGPELVQALLDLDEGQAETELYLFYRAYVVPFGAAHVLMKLVTTLGFNLRRNGIVQFSDSEKIGTPVSESARADVIQMKRQERNSYLFRMLRRVADQNFTFDGKQYPEVQAQHRPSGGISAASTRTRTEITQPKNRM